MLVKAKQLSRIAQLPGPERLEVMAEGIGLISESVRAMLQERDTVWETAPRGSLLLGTLAEEEAAKALILIDYVRPPQGTSPRELAAHIKRAYDHMARGVYVEYYHTRPASFGEVMEIVDRERVSLYLDGPEGFEWIFRNAIMQRREEAMYVDFVEVEGDLQWQSPDFRVRLEEGMRPVPSRIGTLLLAMVDGGLLDAEGLRCLQDVWSSLDLRAETPWTECLRANRDFINSAGRVGKEVPESLQAHVERGLLFPLTRLDTSERAVDRQTLVDARDEAVRNWNPW